METSATKVKRTVKKTRLFQTALKGVQKDAANKICYTPLRITIENSSDCQDSRSAEKSFINHRDTKLVPYSERNLENSRIHDDKSSKSATKCHSDSQKYSGNPDLIKKQFSVLGFKNHNHRKINDTKQEYLSCGSNDKAYCEDGESVDCIVLAEVDHKRIASTSNRTVKVSIKNETSMSEPVSDINDFIAVKNKTSTSEPVLDMNDFITAYPVVSDISDKSSLADYNAQILSPDAEDNYIPPPVTPTVSSIDSTGKNLERNEIFSLHNNVLESTDLVCPDGYKACLSFPDFEHLEAISDFILTVVKERAIPPSSSLAVEVVRDLTLLFKNHFEGIIIEYYGSHYSDLAITTSDINLVIIPPDHISVRKSFMYEIYKILSTELEKYHVHPYEEGISTHQTKINFSHPKTGINCQLAYLGKYKENVFKMGKFLNKMCSIDVRVRKLIIATKIWAECLNINEDEDGKLHPVGFALLVIHFLQHCENPILPIYSNEKVEAIPPNINSSIGELWMAFLKYYSLIFNWQLDVVTINSRKCVSKKLKHWENYWMAIEDPFTGKNIAESVVNCDVADYIKSCFKSSYDYFCNPPESISTSSSDEEDQGNEEPSSCRLKFSFQQCIVEQNEAFCEMCDEIDDICDECKKKIYVQPMASVPNMTDSFLKIIKKALITVYEKYMLSDEEVNERKQFVNEVQNKVCKIYPEAQLNLFGSSTNGFGFKNSDLDICVTFKTKQILNTAAVLKHIRLLLRKDKNFDYVVAIFNAKIPIIKFHYHPNGWRGDISLDNTLAVHNSELLYTYSLIDERCKILGCALKLLAKKAMIVEVTEKALSSYSYLNMVIHFLQQTEPPVLPILQDNKFRENNYKLDHIVENCNVWFCKDLNYIRKVFKTENDKPVEQLWLDLLDYYCSFDYNLCITIRQKEIRYMNENQHFARLFNIQDPFIETKNLGRVVSAKKAQETKSVFNRARQLFRTPVKEIPAGIKDYEDYFFSTMSLTGRIHKEAYCDLCGKFGHEKNECRQSCFPLQRSKYKFPFQRPKYNIYRNRNAVFGKLVNGSSQYRTYKKS